jgi:secondary thiamine-phosphate synthase enzyme
MKQDLGTIEFRTKGPGLHDVTEQVRDFVRQSGIREGLLTCFVQHTSASLVVQENADSDVLADLQAFMERLVSRDESLYRHTTEGPDDMPAHIRTALTSVSLSVPVQAGAPRLGTWQAIYLFEHRDHPHTRTIALHVIGE